MTLLDFARRNATRAQGTILLCLLRRSLARSSRDTSCVYIACVAYSHAGVRTHAAPCTPPATLAAVEMLESLLEDKRARAPEGVQGATSKQCRPERLESWTDQYGGPLEADFPSLETLPPCSQPPKSSATDAKKSRKRQRMRATQGGRIKYRK